MSSIFEKKYHFVKSWAFRRVAGEVMTTDAEGIEISGEEIREAMLSTRFKQPDWKDRTCPFLDTYDHDETD